MITMAGSESLNLQAAEHFVFVDLPWSQGDYTQLIGRMIRIGSQHKTVVAHHMLGIRQSGEKTIDHHVLKALREKMKLADRVAGQALVGGLQFKSEDMVQDILSSMKDNKKDVDPKSTQTKKKIPPKKPATKTLVEKTVKSVKSEESPVEAISLDLSDI
jgi:SNF2 family DNA or RNA helicase